MLFTPNVAAAAAEAAVAVSAFIFVFSSHLDGGAKEAKSQRKGKVSAL